MLNKTQRLLGSALLIAAPFTTFLNAEEASAEAATAAVAAASESEMAEMVGYLTAQGGGIAMLELDAAGVRSLAKGLEQGLKGEVDLMAIPREEMEAAFAQAQARAEAVEAGTEPLPAITADALEKIGLIIVVQSGLQELGFGEADAKAIKKGFISGANDLEISPEMEAKMPAFQNYIQEKAGAMQAAQQQKAGAAAAQNIAAGEAFIRQLKEGDDAVQSTESGLHYKIIEPGGDKKPAMADSVLVHYRGTRIDGTVFDSSYERGQPAPFPLSGVVPGFGQGLTKIGEGGKIILYIPSELAYGNNPRPGGAIQPGDTLIFECELIEINPGK